MMTTSLTRNKNGKTTNFSSGNDYVFYAGAGGSGGFACKEPASFSHIFWGVDVPNESTRNTELRLYNKRFAPYTDSASGMCPHNNGTRQDMTLYVFKDKPTTLNPSLALTSRSLPAILAFPYEIKLNEWELPQPDDTGYDSIIWLALDLGITGLMVDGIPQEFPALRTTSLSWEGQL